jgi:hypothetical protein
MDIRATIGEIKEVLKTKTDKELVEMEIMGNRLIRPPYAFGLEVAKFYKRLIRQLVKEQTYRKLKSWSTEYDKINRSN